MDERRHREIVAVQRADRLDFAHAVGEEHAIGRIQIARHSVELMRGQADGRRQLKHHPARDAGEATALQRRRDDFAVLNPKQIAARGLSDVAFAIGEQGIIGARHLRFARGEDVRDFISGLHRGHRIVIAQHLRGRDEFAGRHRVRVNGRRFVQAHQNRGFKIARRRVAALARAARHVNTQHGVGGIIFRNQRRGVLKQLAKIITLANVQRAHPVLQPANVAVEQKRFAIVHAQRFKNAIAIQKAAIEDRNLRLLLGEELAVEEDNHPRSVRNARPFVKHLGRVQRGVESGKGSIGVRCEIAIFISSSCTKLPVMFPLILSDPP